MERVGSNRCIARTIEPAGRAAHESTNPAAEGNDPRRAEQCSGSIERIIRVM
jgi:hypothetical protein